MTSPARWNDRVRHRLKLRDMDILLAVIHMGSMGKAAIALNTSQSAVSKSIACLEHTLGVRLLDRSRQGVEPTPYGRALVKRGLAMFDELRQGVQDIAFLADPTVGEIRAGGSEGTVSGIFSPIVRGFSEQYPRMSFHIIVGDIRSLLRELDARRTDVVVSRITSPLPDEYSVEPLFEDNLVVAAGANNPMARRRKVELSELMDEPWTFQPSEINFGALVMDAFRRNGLVPPRITVATTSSNLRSELLATGRYLTVTTRCAVLLSRGRSALKVLPVKFTDARHKVAIITLKDRSLSRATALFIDGVRAITQPLTKPK